MNELRNPTQERVNSVLLPAIFFALCLYFIVAIGGYSTYGDEVKSDILENYPNTSATTVARIFISILVCFTYPLQCKPSRSSILNLIRYFSGGQTPSATILNIRYWLVTGAILLLSLLIAVTLSDLGVMVSYYMVFLISFISLNIIMIDNETLNLS